MRQLFVMGGGGFAMEPENQLFDKYILNLAKKEKPKICFIGTASGDSEGYHAKFYSAYNSLPCQPSHLSLFKPPTRDLKSFVHTQDIVHVGGGNTKNMLCLWKEWGLDQILRSAYEKGVVLTGISAGMICWFEEGVTDSFGDRLERLPCLGVLKGSACPHFDGETEREPTYISMIQKKIIGGGLALDDGAGALFIDEALSHCVSSRKNAGAYLFASETATKQALKISFLGE